MPPDVEPTQDPLLPPPAGTPAATRQQLDRALIRGVAWTGAARLVTQVLSWASTIVVANLLTKADYGLLGMATLYINYVQLLNELGLGMAIVRRRDLTAETVSDLGGLAIGTGFLLWAISCVLAVPISGFFGEHNLRWVIAALGFTFVTTAIKVVPRSLLSREMRFRRVAVIDNTEAIVNIVTTLVLAWQGWAYWSLVMGNLLGSTVSTLVALRAHPHPVRWPRSLKPLTEHLALGGHVVGTRTAWYLYSNADFAVVGRVLGKDALGAYSFGWTLATIPINKFASLIGQVMPSVFSAVQHDREALRRYFLLVTEGLALVSFPISAGLFLIAPDLVTVALKPEWQSAVLPLQLLSAYGAFRTLTTVFPQLLQTVGRARDALKYNLIALAVLPVMFFIGSRWGTTGVAGAWIIGYPLVMIGAFRNILEVTGASVKGYFGSIAPAAFTTAVMIAAVLAFRLTVAAQWTPLLRLIGETSLGAASYALMAFTVHGARLRTLRVLLQGARSSAVPAV